MSTSPKEIFETAKKIRTLGKLAESDVRATISRAYYAALHMVDDCIPGKTPKNSKNSHELIIGKIEVYGKSTNPGRTEAKEVTRDMYLFKKKRKVADYEISEEVAEIEADNALTLCASIIYRCDTIQLKISQSV